MMTDLNLMANAIRFLSIDAVEKAASGHPGAPMGMADVATVLWTKFLKFSAKNPKWANRDRFVLSAGHASAMLYSLLYLTGFPDISLDDLKDFRQVGSKTAGHPEYGFLSGIEATTGPLGQGLAMAVGMAIAEAHLNAVHGDGVVDHYTYVMAGDGCLMEGISEEAISLAGHLKLKKLIVFWDNNSITIDGKTDLSTSTNQRLRFESNGWNVLDIDGHDFGQIEGAIRYAQTSDKPTMIACKTTIAFGAPHKAGTSAAHGAPLGADEVAATRAALNWSYPAFEIPDDILIAWRAAGSRSDALVSDRAVDEKLSDNWEKVFQTYKEKLLVDRPVVATRKSSNMALESLVPNISQLIGGSADLTASNLTKVKSARDIVAGDYVGNYINYGIREHAMGAIMNGLSLHDLIPFGGTFLVFSDYMKPSIRLAALMGIRSIYVFTHDSIGVGEDGPTHQPIEQLAMLRSIPNMVVLRPADALETAESWQLAINRTQGPTALVLTRQNVQFLRTSADVNLTARGAYVISSSNGSRMATLIATGSEVGLGVLVQQKLSEQGIDIAVVSMPSMELFNAQPDDYKLDVLGPPDLPRIIIEAASPFGWDKYMGNRGTVLSMHGFGESGKGDQLMKKFGFDVDTIVDTILDEMKN